MIWLVLLHAVVGVAILIAASRLGRWAFALGAVPMAAALGYAAAAAGDVSGGGAVDQPISWAAGLDLRLDMRFDGFALLMVLVISGVGVAVMAYAASYFAPTPRNARVGGLLVLFSGSMVGLVLADSLLAVFLFWELTSITSWLLIGTDDTDPRARAGALHALMVTGAGGLAMLAGFVVIGQAAGTYSLSGILADPPGGGSVGVGLGLVLAGIVTKSAQYPTHAWLPGAMVAPTPVSAYLHSATMVKAGIYLAARLAPVFATVGAWRPAVVVIGLVTMLAGGLRALRQHDLKLLLAMGTISQLGFMLVLVGTGEPEATTAGLVLLLAHALFKAALFLVVGIVDHEAGTRDRRELRGFGPGWGPVKAITIVAAASMAGLPPLLGFVAKEGAYEAFVHEGAWGAAVLAGLVAGSALTVAYSWRFATTVVARPAGDDVAVHAPGRWFVAPAASLAALTVAGGLFVGVLVEPVVDVGAVALAPEVGHVHLALWHGLTAALALSLLTYGLGALLVAGRSRVAGAQRALRPRVTGEDAFVAAVRGLNVAAAWTTRIVQNGSLPIYAAVILLTAVVVPGGALATRGEWPGWPRFADTPLQVLLAAVIVATATGASVVKRRFGAVILLGAVGYGMSLVFVVQGAPDLALTQFGVETLSIVVFMLVLRNLPAHFEQRRPAIATWLRVLVASAVAVGVFAFAMMVSGARLPRTVAPGLVERSLPEAGGRNVVNVVLVDFRGLDTLGEISVLVAAGVGVVALARAGRRRVVEPGGAPEGVGE
ncbi:MAG TPA: hydrogen gas-evolving membrane-bound hydrogenase subunit E [Acidimicrobiales bacterium]